MRPRIVTVVLADTCFLRTRFRVNNIEGATHASVIPGRCVAHDTVEHLKIDICTREQFTYLGPGAIL